MPGHLVRQFNVHHQIHDLLFNLTFVNLWLNILMVHHFYARHFQRLQVKVKIDVADYLK